MNISIIIPTYNGEKILSQNLPKVLQAVKKYSLGTVEIIITDDPSTDNSTEIINAFISSIKLEGVTGKACFNKDIRERGFSKNINRGVKLATGEIIILLNSDVIPHPDFLTPLLSHFEDSRVFGVGCMDESIESGKVVLRGRGIASWRHGFLMHAAGKLDKTTTFWVSGGSSAFRKSVWDRIGGLNEIYNPFYWEDVDLSYRAVKCGYKVLFEPKSIVRHEHEEGTIKKNFSEYDKIKVVYRNQFIFVWINITDTHLLLSHIFWVPYHSLKALMRKDKAYFWGLMHALFRLPQVLAYKEHIAKMFIVPDKKIIESVKN